MHYVRAGAGPPVVYVHGAKGSVYDFTLSVGERLAERYTARRHGPAGLGLQRPAGEAAENTPQAQAAVLRAAATELGLGVRS